MRYVDDARQFSWGINKGWRWVENSFKFNPIWLKEDELANISDDKRTTDLFLQAMNSVMPFLTFTGECPSDFPDNRLPTLDCNLFVSGQKIFHTFFEKPMRSDKSIDVKSALPQNTIFSSLRQEVIRRLQNMHLDLPLVEKLQILDEFYVKLRKSGHNHDRIRDIFVNG